MHEAAVGILEYHEAKQAGQNDDKRHTHFEERSNDRGETRRAQTVGGQYALNDKEVGGPIAATDRETESEDNPGPVNAHGVVGKVAHASPQVSVIACRNLAR